MLRSAASPCLARARRALAPAGVLLSLLLAASPARAEGPIDRARDLFFKGVALVKIGDCERAVVYFKRSLAEVPTYASTLNAAHCLDELKRYDEALEMSEELLTSFAPEPSAQDRSTIEAAVAALRKKVGSIEIAINVASRVTVDGRPRGELPREGPLRVTAGKHVVRITKDGFEPFEQSVEIAAEASVSLDVTLKPAQRPPPPVVSRGSAAQPYPFVGAFGGYAISSSLGSTAEHGSSSPTRGFMTGVRAGYRLSFGLALELSLGYLYVTSEFGRVVVDDRNGSIFPHVTYSLNDDLRFRGPFLGMGASYRVVVNPSLAFLARTTVGVISARSSDAITGMAATTGNAEPGNAAAVNLLVEGKSTVLSSQPAFFMPEIGFETSWGNLHAGALLGVVFLAAEGPAFTRREIGVPLHCPADGPSNSIGCLPKRPIANGELAYGKFAVFVPQLMVGYSF